MRLFAALFGIPQSALPQSWADFAGYVDEMLGSDILAVSGAARSIAARAVRRRNAGAMPQWYRALTASLLPPRLRQDFGLAYGPAEQRSVERAMAVLRRVYPVYTGAPASCRALPGGSRPACRARAAGALTQALNRFWIGQSSMAAGAK